ncbi:ATP-binding cassette domain-containing protein [Pseudothauera rhizosphaerae]|uniref:ATP-binding cassette domain-containing protein n=1 Tax=Pseudothauera rhizosphaerae TaxID=2565932 RepID=A0A4S4AYV6_9RHOO|nr:ATP-binding cassette domain-containing protein [Pseudothauera rhizosphaerae]THF65300.1 ATP-binding cassette domain-containing protein [Pseudothauera rhizosphaerae]
MTAPNQEELARVAESATLSTALSTTRPASGLALQLDAVQRRFGERVVLDDLSISFAAGEFVTVVGKSGCGKSTLLRLLAGLDAADGGRIESDGRALASLKEDVRIMYQDARLLPWQSVADNVALGLPGRRATVRALALEALAQVGLADRADEWPSQLSGGQRQRVALARALVHRPRLLLLDEPLGALDALTRIEMHRLIEQIWREHRFTAVLVTHDVSEAVALADRIVLIEDGRIALDQAVDLARPRSRGDAAFAALEGRVLDRLLAVQALNPRNQIRGRVSAIRVGDVLAEVEVAVTDVFGNPGTVVSTLTARNLQEHALEVGAEVLAVFKSNEVALATPR